MAFHIYRLDLKTKGIVTNSITCPQSPISRADMCYLVCGPNNNTITFR